MGGAVNLTPRSIFCTENEYRMKYILRGVQKMAPWLGLTPGLLRVADRGPAGVCRPPGLGFGRIVVSEIEAPTVLADLKCWCEADERRCRATMQPSPRLASASRAAHAASLASSGKPSPCRRTRATCGRTLIKKKIAKRF
jgi:hypothetical protein